MILSHKKIEEIGMAVMLDFNEFFFGEETEDIRMPRATPIDQFAKDFLGLDVKFAPLSRDGSICGLTAYADTEYIAEEAGVKTAIPIKRNQVILDESFIQPSQIRKLCGKRRFTLAHECAHQILFQLESEEERERYQRKYSAQRAYSLRDLKSREDWNEWQANALGAAILMPQKEIDLAMKCFYYIKNHIGFDSQEENLCVHFICQQFGVSRIAAAIRLKELGYSEEITSHFGGGYT